MGREIGHMRRTTPEQREKMFKLKQKGVTNEILSLRFGITIGRVSTICNQMLRQREEQERARQEYESTTSTLSTDAC